MLKHYSHYTNLYSSAEYSRISLSPTWLSRISRYLEPKVNSFETHNIFINMGYLELGCLETLTSLTLCELHWSKLTLLYLEIILNLHLLKP